MPTIALTRPRGVEHSLANGLAQAGWAVLDCALTQIAPASRAELDHAHAVFAQADAVVLVSPQAVNAALAHARAALRGKLVAVMGPGSRAALLAGGVTDAQIVESATQDGLGLLQPLLQRLPARACVAIGRAQAGRDDLARALSTQGMMVNFATLYQRHATAWPATRYAQLEQASSTALHVLFTTSSAPKDFAARLAAHSTTLDAAVRRHASVHCTHTNVAQAAQEAGFAQVLTHPASIHTLVASLQSHHAA
jgi:uroporphyrinogen-III synthase